MNRSSTLQATPRFSARGWRAGPIAFLIIGMFLAASPCLAAPRASVDASKNGARLLVGGKLVAAFRTRNGSLEPAQRAGLAAARINAAASEQVTVQSRGKGWAVLLGGDLVMLATANEAAARGESTQSVAKRWAANLRAALGQSAPTGLERGSEEAGRIGVRANSGTVPVGEDRSFPIRGNARGEVGVRSDSPDVAEARVNGGNVVVRGITPGQTVIRVTRGTVETAFKVWVKRLAGRIQRVVDVPVTGVETPETLVRRVAAERVFECIDGEPGAVVKVVGEPEGIRSLPRGDSIEVGFPVSIEAEGCLTQRGIARMRIVNVPLPARDPDSLLYSNEPESIREYGTLYEGLVEHQGPVRFLYHHQNRTGKAVVFQLQLLNPGPEPADVQVVEADAGPFVEPMQAGHRAAQKYLAAVVKDIGYITRVPARGSRVILTVAVPERDTVSGIYTFRVVSGGSIVAQTVANAGKTAPQLRDDLLEAARGEPNTYPSPQKVQSHSHQIGAPWTFMPVGRVPIVAKNGRKKLFGNYGVLYKLKIQIHNPLNDVETVRVVMTPDAGWARGTFLVDGKLVEAPQLAPPAELQLLSVKLQPNERREVEIQSIPASGSSYPITVVVRP